MAIGAIIGAITIGSAIFNAIGQAKAGNAAKELAEFNAHVADLQAEDALSMGEDEAQRFRAGVRGLIGRQRAGFAAQNIDVGVGSPVEVVADAAFLGELDALTIKTNAARAAWGYRVQGENFRRGGSNAQTASRFGAAASIVGGATSVLELRYGFRGSGNSGGRDTFVPAAGTIEASPPGRGTGFGF